METMAIASGENRTSGIDIHVCIQLSINLFAYFYTHTHAVLVDNSQVIVGNKRSGKLEKLSGNFSRVHIHASSKLGQSLLNFNFKITN